MTGLGRSQPLLGYPASPRPRTDPARVSQVVVLALLVTAVIGWRWTVERMAGMNEGPWSTLGGFGWFMGVWVGMMAAMMLPSVAPTVALYVRMTRSGQPLAACAFTAGYLLTWAAAGVVVHLVATGVTRMAGGTLAWDVAGQPVAGALLVVAAIYEMTPLKNICLGRCRSPVGFLIGAWRDGWRGGVRMGAQHGAWCLGCCWALMAALFALGVMSVTWMALIAGLIALEKLLPWRRWATFATAAVLLGLALCVLIAPAAVPALTVPGGDGMSMSGGFR